MQILTALLHNAGAALVPGMRAFVRAPITGPITCGFLGSRTAGDLVVDVLVGASPDTAVSVTASAPLTLASSTEYEDAWLSGWSRDVAAGEWIGFEVVSVSGVTTATAGVRLNGPRPWSRVYIV